MPSTREIASPDLNSPNESGVRYVVFFDGVCKFCDATVQFLIKIDRRRRLRYAPLQGETALSFFDRRPTANTGLRSMIFVADFGAKNECVYVRSDGVLQVLRILGGLPWCLSSLRIIPRPIRDSLYEFIANHRYRWFGKYDSCIVPDAHIKQLFMK